jgi:hypothetical protein
MLRAGAAFVIPALVILTLVTSGEPARDLARAVAIIFLALVGGAASGFAHALLLPLNRGPLLMRWSGAVLTVAPYFAVLCVILRLIPGGSYQGEPYEKGDLIVVSVMSVVIGTFLTTTMFPGDEH